MDLYPYAVAAAAGLWIAVQAVGKFLNRPTVAGRIISLFEKWVDRRTQVELERESRITELAREQEQRITEIAREQERRMTEVALERERRMTQVMLEEEKRKTDVACERERRARLTAVAGAVPSGAVLTDQPGDGSSIMMEHKGPAWGSSQDDLTVAALGDAQ